MKKWKKKASKQKKIIKIISDNTVLYDGELYRLPIKDEKVIQGSIDFFDDPEPCMIHKSAVISRYYAQIHEWLDTFGEKNIYEVSLTEIPEEILELIGIDR